MNSKILCGDSVEIIKSIPSDSIHLILSDIPYGIGIDDWDILHSNINSAYGGKSPAQKKAGQIFKRRGKPINGWSKTDKNIPYEYYEWCNTWAREWLRVLKPGGTAFVFAGRRFVHRCITALEDSGFNYRDMLGWIKPKAAHRAQRISKVFERRGDLKSSNDWQGWRLGNLKPSFEPIIWCAKPYKTTVSDNVLENRVGAYNQDAFSKYFGSIDNYFTCGMETGESGLHSTQKPQKLMEALIELVTETGQTVLDPFAGSGTTGIAAKALNRNYILIERSKDIYNIANKRINKGI